MRLPPPDRLAATALIAAALACGDSRSADQATGFRYEAPSSARPTLLLRVDTVVAGAGAFWMDLDVLIAATTEGDARTTLQHLVDSVATADTLAVAVRAAGFQMGPVDPETQTADIEPAMLAVWGPPDSVWAVGARRERYRFTFTILRPFPAAAPTARP
jgi:hypothetical protein